MFIRGSLMVLSIVFVSNSVGNEDIDLEGAKSVKNETFSSDDLLGRIFSLASQVEGRQHNSGFGLLINDEDLNNYYNNPGYPGIQPVKKRRRRRRKPKRQNYQLIGQNYSPNQLLEQNHQNLQQQSDQGVLNTLTDALGSIAKHDDYQCVPRLLCEATSGSEANIGQNSFLSSFVNIEPLLNLLSASSLMSSSPLFVFGRAALLGITSRQLQFLCVNHICADLNFLAGNSASCRYAYPSCPQDPERLVEYLNYHNGGFFRFFGGVRPQYSGPSYAQMPAGQLQQFYQLISQNLQNQGIQNAGNAHQFYHQLSQNQVLQNVGNPEYALYNNQDGFGYGRPGKKRQRKPIKMGGNVVFPEYREVDNGYVYNYSDFGYETDETINNIENRILNGLVKNEPSNNYDIQSEIYSEDSFPEDANPNFKFPEGSTSGPEVDGGKRKREKSLKFPVEEPIEFAKTHYHADKPFFPRDSSKLDSAQYGRPEVYKGAFEKEGSGDDFLYIVRGNGDPSKPEIVKIRGGRYY